MIQQNSSLQDNSYSSCNKDYVSQTLTNILFTSNEILLICKRKHFLWQMLPSFSLTTLASWLV